MLAEAAEAAAVARDGELLARIQAAVGAGSPLGGAISQVGKVSIRETTILSQQIPLSL